MVQCKLTKQCEESRPLVSKKNRLVKYKNKLVTLSDELWNIIKNMKKNG